ncbi:DUF4175 family protein [Acetobacter suratthaniensis]|uniref:DUF4175 family protein n=1 Tax=Acetobacter suratthaniensis TaxID=1502841 RepID=A0ABS3LHS6_9PROT|nr:DUF4175 family protein [Acetobacter suratthaniensis]MBO1327129.1 DUF4175 family protein [Acetobacter suratthaniensis]MCX2565260.1 DUF4175 family protein [Acetobacter suratthaniensis]
MGGSHDSLTARNPDTGPLSARLASVRRHAAFVLHVERVRPVALPVLAVLGLYVLAGLCRLPQHLPDLARWLLLLGGAGLCYGLLRTRLRSLPAIPLWAIDRRIEQASNLPNQPLAVLEDRPASLAVDDERTQALWLAHQARTLAALKHLRAGWPSLLPATLPGRAAMGGLLACLFIAGLLAGSAAPGRILAAFIPGRDDPDVPLPHVEAWITPPSYAPDAPVFLGTNQNPAHPPQIAQSARLSVIVSGMASAPTLRGLHGAVLSGQTVQTLDTHSWKLGATIEQGGVISLRGRGRTLALWPLTVLPDAKPKVEWGDAPGALAGGWRTRLPYQASHAYGLSELTVVLHAAHPARGADTSRTLTLPVPLTGHPRSVRGALTPDLSEDPWAGTEVAGQLVAHSLSNQTGESRTVTFKLGARVFRSPLARSVLDVRRRLALGQETTADAANDLDALAGTPGPLQDSTALSLNLAAIVALLDNPHEEAATARESATNLLWDLALDVEDRRTGDAASAQASLDVRAAQAAVAQQLARQHAPQPANPQNGTQNNTQNNDGQAELEERLKTLSDAISRKMQALADNALRTHTAIPDLPGLTAAGNKAFSHLMQQLQSDAANGHAEDAMKRLQDMEDATERMRNATPQDLASMARQMVARQQAREQMAALKDVTSRQLSLLDHVQARLDKPKTPTTAPQDADADADDDGAPLDLAHMPTSELMRRLGLPAPPGAEDNRPDTVTPPERASASTPPDPAVAEAQAAARRTERGTQHALERAVEELQNEVHDLTSKSPEALGEARKQMRAARKALADGNDADAAGAEQKALDALRQGRQQMQDAMKGSQSNSSPSFLPSFGGQSEGGSPGQQGQSARGENGEGTPTDADDGGDDQDNANDQRDPLGRKLGEGQDQAPDDGSTHVPDTVTRQRAREIEQELRRRDSDRTRPPQELEYLDRLLKPF